MKQPLTASDGDDREANMAKVRTAHIVSAVFHSLSFVAQLVLVIIFWDRLLRVPLRIQIGVQWSLLSCDLPVAALLLAFPVVTAIFHVLGTRRHVLKKSVTHGMDMWRWIEYSITAAVMTVGVALSSGVWDVNALIVIVLINIVVMQLGYDIEAAFYLGERTLMWRLFAWSSLAFVAQWYPIFYSFFNLAATVPDLPWLVYTVIFTLFGLNLTFPILVAIHLTQKRKSRWLCGLNLGDNTTYAIAFMVLSFVSKATLNWLVLIGGLEVRGDIVTQVCSALR